MLEQISDDTKEQIIGEAERSYPKEMCGVIVDNGGNKVFIKTPNIAAKYEIDDEDSFVICPRTLSSIEDRFDVVAIVHSHPNYSAKPSPHDIARCNQGNIPWIIVSYPDIDISITYPSKEEVPLIGREFVHGLQDCYTLIKDYYKKEFGIILGEYERDDEWWEKGQDLYIDNYEREGFISIEESELAVGDLLLMQIESGVTNHAAVMYEDNVILHHLYGRESCLGIYGGYWRDRTTRILRHKERKI